MIPLRISPGYDCDVVIAGGGPAGASGAARLASAGLRVLLLDRQRFPRDKVCGDFVGPVALIELDALGVTSREGYVESNIIRQAALYLDGKELIRRPIPEIDGLPPYGRCIPRLTLDAWCIDAARRAGATVVERARVTGFDVQRDGITVNVKQGEESRNIRARLLIGADGSSSTVSRELRGAAPPDEDRIIAVRAYYEGDAGPEDQADLYFGAESFPGYYWLFPTGAGYANVGVGMVLETLPPTSDHLRELLLGVVESDSALHARLERGTIVGKVIGWPLTTYNAKLPIIGERVMLVGDAAGFINPLNGEGIQYALTSGRWAADCALDCFVDDDFSELRLSAYANRAERELRHDMALAGLIVQFIRNRHLNVVWLEALKVISARARADREYAEITGGILAGLVPAHDALTLKVLGGTLDQAVYSAGLQLAWAALKGPKHLGERGLGAAKDAATIAAEVMNDPAGFLNWIVGLVRQGGELAMQFGSQIGRHPNGGVHAPPPALTPQTVRVRLPA
jgi:menaquinone-9 beta-reductase